MQKRAVRTVVLVLLLALGIGASLEAWGVDRRLARLDGDYGELSNRIARLQSAITFLAAAQNTYIGSGQPDELSLNRVSVLVQQIATDTADIRTRIRADNSASHLQAFADGLASLINADARSRQNLAQGQALAAADAIFRESRESVATMEAKLRELRYAEAASFDGETARAEDRRLRVVGGVGLLWALGLIAFARLPSARAIPAQILGDLRSDPPAAVPAAESPVEARLDLTAAADVCIAISRLSDADALPHLLSRAALVLDAPGLIVWMGAGNELFAAAAHGYDAAVLDRVGPISRTGDNATALAWRSGEARVVRSDQNGNGAIAVPMWAADACIGVFAAEVRHGREGDTATRAVTSMIAAQLATVLPVWPAASAPEQPESERHAAAS
jgi:hypothetical protein